MTCHAFQEFPVRLLVLDPRSTKGPAVQIRRIENPGSCPGRHLTEQRSVAHPCILPGTVFFRQIHPDRPGNQLQTHGLYAVFFCNRSSADHAGIYRAVCAGPVYGDGPVTYRFARKPCRLPCIHAADHHCCGMGARHLFQPEFQDRSKPVQSLCPEIACMDRRHFMHRPYCILVSAPLNTAELVNIVLVSNIIYMSSV